MKKISIFIYCLFLSLTQAYADEQKLFVQLNANFHELNNDELNSSSTTDSKCYNCHLFDKKLDSLSEWLTPQTHANTEIQNLDTSNGEPDSFSRACLMCHDGNEASLVINAPISPCGIRKNVSVSMGKENHPIFMEYTYDDEINNPESVLRGEWEGAVIVADILRDGKVVCISCHVPHKKKNGSFIRTSNRNSGLCRGCHNK